MPMAVDTNMSHVYSKQPHPGNGHPCQYGKKSRNSRHVEFKSHNVPKKSQVLLGPMQVRGMARRQEKTSEKLKLQAVQKCNYRQKTARILYCGMQAGTHQKNTMRRMWKKVRKLSCHAGQHALHVLQ